MRSLLKLTTPVFLLLFVGLLSMQFLQSCKKRIDYIDGQIIPFDNATKVNASVFGRVIDEAGLPIENAVVTSGTYTTTTNADGLFFLRNMNTPQHATCVVVKKANYFSGSRTLMVKAGQAHQVNVTLMARGIPKTFTASNGGTVDFNNGMKITFDPNTIYNPSTGDNHYGQVYVYAKKIDANTEEGRNSMPGELRGVSEINQDEQVLRSFGMMVAELTDVTGNPLQIKSTSEALVTFDIPSSVASLAPSSLPLWYFDETSGMWMENGIAYLKNGKYEGAVKHFSFWNCDQPAASVNFEVTLVDQNNNPLQGYTVKLTNQANNDSRFGTTNNNGWVGGLAYANATLTMEVFNGTNVCSSTASIYTQNVVTSSININLGTIAITLPSLANCTFDGTIIDCTNLPNANTAIYVTPLNVFVTPDASGYFTYTLPCVPTMPVTITAYDLANLVNGSTTTTLVAGTNNLGNVYACGNVTPFLNLTLTNTVNSNVQNVNFLAPLDSIAAFIDTTTTIGAVRTGANNMYFGWITADTIAGTFAPTAVNCFVGNSTFSDTQFTLAPGSTITYSSLPIFPGHILGNYTINLIGQPSGQTYTAVGNFRAPRKN